MNTKDIFGIAHHMKQQHHTGTYLLIKIILLTALLAGAYYWYVYSVYFYGYCYYFDFEYYYFNDGYSCACCCSFGN
ncbi:hypothetical protein [Pseudoflavitalea rhizosphaerae]|uniref:hypothetical protein n=1 Tax=Pseudoflavitalea rhizosphaerae TaxID=1884793 RepID=UPI000F8D52FD|nr:hypothetical protein [Pseudoflavitalea rhizosphaerae]